MALFLPLTHIQLRVTLTSALIYNNPILTLIIILKSLLGPDKILHRLKMSS